MGERACVGAGMRRHPARQPRGTAVAGAGDCRSSRLTSRMPAHTSTNASAFSHCRKLSSRNNADSSVPNTEIVKLKIVIVLTRLYFSKIVHNENVAEDKTTR